MLGDGGSFAAIEVKPCVHGLTASTPGLAWSIAGVDLEVSKQIEAELKGMNMSTSCRFRALF